MRDLHSGACHSDGRFMRGVRDARLLDGLESRLAAFSQSPNIVNEDQIVVDHHTGGSPDAEIGKHGHCHPEGEVAIDGAHESEGDGGHDQQRQPV